MWWLMLAMQVQPMLDLTWTGGTHAYTFNGWDINSDGYADAVVSYSPNGFENDSVAIYLLPNNTHAVTYTKGSFPSVDVVGTWGNGRVLLEYTDWNNGTVQVEVMDNYTSSVFQSPVFSYQGYVYVGITDVDGNGTGDVVLGFGTGTSARLVVYSTPWTVVQEAPPSGGSYRPVLSGEVMRAGRLTLKQPVSGPVEVWIRDAQGRLRARLHLRLTSPTRTIQLPSLPFGVYGAEVRTLEGVYRARVVEIR
jgi:hypothetical protein